MKGYLLTAILVLVSMVLSLSVHEWAHAFTAYKLGDDTAKRMGRLTLSPEKHIDIFGSIVFPVLGVFIGFLFGWAKPVPFEPRNFTRKISMKTGTLLVALAGPVSNLILAILCAIGLKLLVMYGGRELLETSWGEPAARLLGASLHLNVVLFVFNFMPIPPLDGSKILYGLLPRSAEGVIDWLERYQMFVFIGFLFVGASLIAQYIMYPLLLLIVTVAGLEPVVQYVSLHPGG